MKKLISEILNALGRGEHAAFAVVTGNSGSTPRKTGSAMAVFEDGHSLGTVGGGAIEHEVTRVCRDEVLGSDAGAISQQVGYSLVPNGKGDLHMICGGDVNLHIQKLAPEKELISTLEAALGGGELWLCLKTGGENTSISVCGPEGCAGVSPELLGRRALYEEGVLTLPLREPGHVYIFGGGHVGRALCDALSRIDFACVVFDDREQFSSKDEHPLAERTVRGDFTRIAEYVTLTDNDYVVVVTRGHEFDYDVLAQTLPSKAMYVGCMGSRRKMAVIRERLREESGLAENDIARLCSPIGVQIGAETPEELAVSIAAELISVRANSR